MHLPIQPKIKLFNGQTDNKDYNEIDDLLDRVKVLAISKKAVIYEWKLWEGLWNQK